MPVGVRLRHGKARRLCVYIPAGMKCHRLAFPSQNIPQFASAEKPIVRKFKAGKRL